MNILAGLCLLAIGWLLWRVVDKRIAERDRSIRWLREELQKREREVQDAYEMISDLEDDIEHGVWQEKRKPDHKITPAQAATLEKWLNLPAAPNPRIKG